MNEPYKLLCAARESLGRAHDQIAEAVMDHGGGPLRHLCGVCERINDLIEVLHGACGACDTQREAAIAKAEDGT